MNTLTLTPKQIQDLRFFLMTWGNDQTEVLDEEGYNLLKDEAWGLVWSMKEQVGN